MGEKKQDRVLSVWWGRFVAPVVAVVIVAISGALALVSENVSNRQEHQLLKERAAEVTAVLSTSISEIRTLLQGAGNAALSPRRPDEFKAATALATATPGTAIVVAKSGTAGFKVVAANGSGGPAVGTAVDPLVLSVVGRALAAKGEMVSGVVDVSGIKNAVVAVGITGSGGGVAYYQYVLGPVKPAPTDANSPYHELNAAIYAGKAVDRSQLMMVSGAMPKSGDAVVKQFKVGADTWTLQVTARTKLVGSLASAFPLVVAGAGLAMALFMGSLIHILMRRRAYALRLVAERTQLLQEAQLTAERANNAKSEFLSRMSHELRTPLNAVLGFAQLLELNGLTPDQAENVTQIRRGGTYLLELINEILDISQIESGRLSMSPEPVLVHDVIEAAISLVRPLAGERSVTLITSTDREPDRFVFADSQRLKQILINLLSNGIKYNRNGGSVSVSCFEPSPGALRIQVTDTGPGIPADKRELLFVPFERLGAEHTAVEGTGVGLALSRGLAKAMGGRLEVDSTQGRGSTFWVEFPIVEDPTRQLDQAEDQEPERELPSDKLAVLHIEDNPANLALVERVLAQRPELTLMHATRGRQGLDMAMRDRPVLVLLDLNLPDLHGTEVLKELRADPRTENIPVIVISADAMPRQMQHLLSAGAAAYLTKPIDIRDLLSQIDDVLGVGAGQ